MSETTPVTTMTIDLTPDGAHLELRCEHGTTAADVTGDPSGVDTPEGVLLLQLDHHRLVGCYCTPDLVLLDGGPRLN